MEWLRRIIRRLLGRKEPKKIVHISTPAKDDDYFRRQFEQPRVPKTGPRGIRGTDLGMRKVARHGRRARQFEKRSGIDHSKRMVDAEDGQTKPRKKKTWFEDRKR